MFSKKNKATKKNIQMLFSMAPRNSKGFLRVFFGNYLTFRFLILKEETLPKISFLTPQNLKEKAVFRNLLRRKGYFVLKKYLKYFPKSFIGVFIFNKKGAELFKLKNKKEPLASLEIDIKNLLKKAELFK